MITGKENLKREIGVRALTLALLNILIGSGIFVIPAIIAETLGTAAIVAYLVCGALVFLIALCFAEVASKTTISGGIYTYIERAFGPYTGFLANNLYWLGCAVVADAAIANALADTLKYFFPFLGNEVFRALFFLVVFGGLALLNIRSVKNSVRFIEFATVAKLTPLVLLLVAGTAFVSVENLRWTSIPTLKNTVTASLLLFFAFTGVETPLINGGEIKNAKRTVPLSVLLGIGGMLILVMAIQLVTQGVLGTTITLHKDAPLAAVGEVIAGKAGFALVIVATALSMLGLLSGEILSIPRMLFAGARDGLMPKPLASVHPRFFTPHIAVAFYATLGFLFAVAGGFKQLAIISSACTLLIYLGTVLATLKLRKTTLADSEKPFTVPGGVIVPLLATGGILWLLSGLTKSEFTGISIFLVVLSVIYVLVKLAKKNL